MSRGLRWYLTVTKPLFYGQLAKRMSMRDELNDARTKVWRQLDVGTFVTADLVVVRRGEDRQKLNKM